MKKLRHGRCRSRLRFVFAVLATLLPAVSMVGCDRLAGPEQKVEAYMRAAYEGQGGQLKDMMLHYESWFLDDGKLRTTEELIADTRVAIETEIAKEASLEKTENYEEYLQKFEEMERAFETDALKASLDLRDRGKLVEVETILVERDGAWACVKAEYRFEDGRTHAPERHQNTNTSKGEKSSGFAPDGYYFLHFRDGKWFVLEDLPEFVIRRFTITAASGFLDAVLKGRFQIATRYLPGVSPDSEAVDETFDSLRKIKEDQGDPLSGASLAFGSRQESERFVVVSYTARVTDVDQEVRTADLPILLFREGGFWRVDRNEIEEELGKIRSLARELISVREAKRALAEQEALSVRRQPVVVLDQVRSLVRNWKSVGLEQGYTAPSDGWLHLEVEVRDGSPVSVDLLAPGQVDKLRRGESFRAYTAFNGRGVIRQAFEMPTLAGTEYLLVVGPEEEFQPTTVEVKFWFDPKI